MFSPDGQKSLILLPPDPCASACSLRGMPLHTYTRYWPRHPCSFWRRTMPCLRMLPLAPPPFCIPPFPARFPPEALSASRAERVLSLRRRPIFTLAPAPGTLARAARPHAAAASLPLPADRGPVAARPLSSLSPENSPHPLHANWDPAHLSPVHLPSCAFSLDSADQCLHVCATPVPCPCLLGCRKRAGTQ